MRPNRKSPDDKKEKEPSIRQQLYYAPDSQIEDKSDKEYVRVNVRLSGEIASYLEHEARRTGSNMSALCSLAITDWVDDRRRRQGYTQDPET